MAMKTRADVEVLTAAAAELRRLVERLDAASVPGRILDTIAEIAQDLDDVSFERTHGRVRWCRCANHDGRYDLHAADEARRTAERRRQEAERERQRLEAESRRQEASGWV